jgi:hypothetical protein
MRPKYASTVSDFLLRHVHTLFYLSLDEIIQYGRAWNNLNAYTSLGLPAYVSAASAIECFLNEKYLTPSAWKLFEVTPLARFSRESILNMSIPTKVLLLSELGLQSRFANDSLFDDLSILVKMRNDIVHYKFDPKRPPYIERLVQKGYALPTSTVFYDLNYTWIGQINCSEGVRWAFNTACAVIREMIGITVDTFPDAAPLWFYPYALASIEEDDVQDWLRDHDFGYRAEGCDHDGGD